jgi:peptidoglycan/LPS O-acetylase OafA/YrhL
MAVVVFGVAGLLKRRWVIPAVFVVALCATAYFSYPIFAMQTIPQMVARFAVMFAAGALLHQYRDVIPARWWLVAISIIVVLASGLLSNYRVIGAIPLAYAVIVSGALVRHRRLNLRNDLSYGMYIYAFPMQQMLVVVRLGTLNLFLFFAIATVATLPLAALSWFLVERYAISLKSRLKQRRTAAVSDQSLTPRRSRRRSSASDSLRQDLTSPVTGPRRGRLLRIWATRVKPLKVVVALHLSKHNLQFGGLGSSPRSSSLERVKSPRG